MADDEDRDVRVASHLFRQLARGVGAIPVEGEVREPSGSAVAQVCWIVWRLSFISSEDKREMVASNLFFLLFLLPCRSQEQFAKFRISHPSRGVTSQFHTPTLVATMSLRGLTFTLEVAHANQWCPRRAVDGQEGTVKVGGRITSSGWR